MGTRSRIGIEYPDGIIESVYCHWDGYPDHNGKILQESYTTIEKVLELLAQGDMSSLGANIGMKHSFDARPDDDTCTFYKRDRGESDVDSIKHLNLDEYMKYLERSDAEYVYLYRLQAWWVWDMHEEHPEPLYLKGLLDKAELENKQDNG